MLETIKALTTEYDMLPRGGTVLCAVSGGADSMCLLHLLHTWAGEGGFRVAAAHYNHNLVKTVAWLSYCIIPYSQFLIKKQKHRGPDIPHPSHGIPAISIQ